MQQKSATTKMKGGIMKTLSNPLLKFDTYIDIKTAMSQQAYPIVLNGCVDRSGYGSLGEEGGAR